MSSTSGEVEKKTKNSDTLGFFPPLQIKRKPVLEKKKYLQLNPCEYSNPYIQKAFPQITQICKAYIWNNIYLKITLSI